ncbi:hypothetical protein CEXT_113241 [Caerostris extrusa]|uniref:Uncharacterized protein n=1 Tax=Caerostris extrusa TaxID=172846 RepID=A0AAV4XAS8_CAEEX|nr:hypothetical protein CEXT_113241 [Caerostris extrusa]
MESGAEETRHLRLHIQSKIENGAESDINVRLEEKFLHLCLLTFFFTHFPPPLFRRPPFKNVLLPSHSNPSVYSSAETEISPSLSFNLLLLTLPPSFRRAPIKNVLLLFIPIHLSIHLLKLSPSVYLSAETEVRIACQKRGIEIVLTTSISGSRRNRRGFYLGAEGKMNFSDDKSLKKSFSYSISPSLSFTLLFYLLCHPRPFVDPPHPVKCPAPLHFNPSVYLSAETEVKIACQKGGIETVATT